MPTIFIDGAAHELGEGKNLLDACLSLGMDLPYFCWHPAMGSVGACRQCAVRQFRDENDTRGRIAMACMTPATEGARISIDDPSAREFRQAVIEWLMVNHPHDCPVCDEGGECHLQDMTVMTGHTYRRYRGPKRTYRNQYLGPFLGHEMNRCIQCYRCVRFYRDFAGGTDLDAYRLRNAVYFGRSEDGVLESEFAGNLAEVCPTGVFTDKTLGRHYTRKWDLQSAPSVCTHCSVGCNINAGERYGSLRRIVNRYNRHVNGYFLCDRGRFGYEFVNSDQRLLHPQMTDEQGSQTTVDQEKAVSRVSYLMRESVRLIGIGSQRASLEANFALRTLVGPENFYVGVPDAERELLSTIADILRNGPARSPSLHDMELCDAVLILGEDVTNTAPMIDFALRQSVRRQPMQLARKLNIPDWDDYAVRGAIQDAKGPLFIATPTETKLDGIATQTYRVGPSEIASLGQAVAAKLGGPKAAVPGEDKDGLADQIAGALRSAERPLVIAGTSLQSRAIVEAAANVAWALVAAGCPAELSYVLPSANSMGLALMGSTGGLEAAAGEAESAPTTALILETDLYRHLETQAADRLMAALEQTVVLDCIQTQTTARASVALPSSAWVEGDGTFVNNEGRAQRFYQAYVPQEDVQESWRFIQGLMNVRAGASRVAWHDLTDVVDAMADALPVFAPVRDLSPRGGFDVKHFPVARQPARYSGRTAMSANETVHEPPPPEDPDAPMTFSMEGYNMLPGGPVLPSLIPRFWAPGWNSYQAVNKFQSEIAGELVGGDPGRRLIEPATGVTPRFFESTQPATETGAGEWLVLPAYHIFGSEELSALAPGIAELAPGPYLGVNPLDAGELGLEEGATVQLQVLEAELWLDLPLRLAPSLPRGTALLPAGLPGLQGVPTPRACRIRPGRDATRGEPA